MIHYHGTPIGGTRIDVARFLTGRHALVPFARPDDMGAVLEYCSTFCLDNSAFTNWKKGGKVDFDAYVEWVGLYSRHPNYDWCLIPDVIDGEEAENRDLVDRWASEGSGKGIPIWHLNESLTWLNELADGEWVALGSSGAYSVPNSLGWWRRIAEVMEVLCDSDGRPRCKIHGLRMLDPDIFTRLPFSSADSTNAAVNCGAVTRFGMYPSPTAGQRACVIGDRIESFNSSSIWINHRQEAFDFGQ